MSGGGRGKGGGGGTVVSWNARRVLALDPAKSPQWFDILRAECLLHHSVVVPRTLWTQYEEEDDQDNEGESEGGGDSNGNGNGGAVNGGAGRNGNGIAVVVAGSRPAAGPSSSSSSSSPLGPPDGEASRRAERGRTLWAHQLNNIAQTAGVKLSKTGKTLGGMVMGSDASEAAETSCMRQCFHPLATFFLRQDHVAVEASVSYTALLTLLAQQRVSNDMLTSRQILRNAQRIRDLRRAALFMTPRQLAELDGDMRVLTRFRRIQVFVRNWLKVKRARRRFENRVARRIQAAWRRHYYRERRRQQLSHNVR